MPCYNGSKYIVEAINSVINQTYKNWELLVIDDSSTDNSCEIVEEFCGKDERIKLLHNPVSTKMPSTPRNVGITNATGRFIAFLDCDDKWEPQKLEKQIRLFDDEKCAVAFSYYKKDIDTKMEGILEMINRWMKMAFKEIKLLPLLHV